MHHVVYFFLSHDAALVLLYINPRLKKKKKPRQRSDQLGTVMSHVTRLRFLHGVGLLGARGEEVELD